jgi:hypothetical protein
MKGEFIIHMNKTFRRSYRPWPYWPLRLLSACAKPARFFECGGLERGHLKRCDLEHDCFQAQITSSETSSSAAASSSTASSSAPNSIRPIDEQDITATVDFWETFGASGTTATTA